MKSSDLRLNPGSFIPRVLLVLSLFMGALSHGGTPTSELGIQLGNEIQTGTDENLKLLLQSLSSEKLAETLSDPGWGPIGSHNLFTFTVALGNYSKAEVILRLHPAAVNYQTSNGNYPLHIAVLERDLPMVRLLMDFGANPQFVNSTGETPLHYAAIEGESIMAELLLSHGALPLAQNQGFQTPLHIAAALGKQDFAGTVVAHGTAQADSPKNFLRAMRSRDSSDRTPFDFAADLGQFEFCEWWTGLSCSDGLEASRGKSLGFGSTHSLLSAGSGVGGSSVGSERRRRTQTETYRPPHRETPQQGGHFEKYVVVRKMPGKGRGLVVTKPVPKRSLLGYYPIDLIEYLDSDNGVVDTSLKIISQYAKENWARASTFDERGRDNYEYALNGFFSGRRVLGYPLDGKGERESSGPDFQGHLMNDASPLIDGDPEAFRSTMTPETMREKVQNYLDAAARDVNVYIEPIIYRNAAGNYFMKVISDRDIPAEKELVFFYGPNYWIYRYFSNCRDLTLEEQYLTKAYYDAAAKVWLENYRATWGAVPSWWIETTVEGLFSGEVPADGDDL